MHPLWGRTDTTESRGHRGRNSRRGMSLIEVLVAFSAFLVTMLAFSKVIVGSMAATSTNHESSLAKEAGRAMIETLAAEDFEQVFALYNNFDADDPVFGAAPGGDFPVGGLEPLPDDADGMVGEILFPTAGAALLGLLNENVRDKRFGCPRDLNGDGDANDQIASGDYGLLPVIVRLEWVGSAGPASIELRTLLADYF